MNTTDSIIISRLKAEINAAIYRVVGASAPSELPTPTQIAHALAMTAGEWARLASERENAKPESPATAAAPAPINPPDGYRLLENGELISTGDIFYMTPLQGKWCSESWSEASSISIGQVYDAQWCVPYARRIEPDATTKES